MNGPTFAVQTPTTAARPAAARPPAPPRPAAKADADAGGMLRMLAWLRLYWLTILFCGSLLGAGLAALAWELLPSKYESYALLRVASSPFSVSNAKDPNQSRTDFNTYLKTNAKLIRNEFVLNKALSMEIEGSRISELPTIKAQKNPMQFLEEELQVIDKEGVEIITIAMKGHNPDDVRKIVNAVQKAFMEEVIEKETRDRSTRAELVEGQLIKLQTDLVRMVGKPAAPAAGAVGLNGVLLPPVPGAAVPAIAGANPPAAVQKFMAENSMRKVVLLRESIADLPLQIASQTAKAQSLDKQLKALSAGEPSKEVLAEVENDPDVRNLIARESLYRAKYSRDRSLYANPDAESVTALLDQANRAAAELTALKLKKAHDLEQGKRQGKANELAVQLDEAVRKLRDLEDKLRADQKRLVDVEAEVAQLPADAQKTDEKKAEEKRQTVNPDNSILMTQDDIFRDIAHRAATLRLDIDSPKRVTVLQTASQPMQKDTKKQLLGTIFAGLTGFGLVGLVVVGVETKAKKVSGLVDLKNSAPTAVVGVVPWHADGKPHRPDVAEGVDKLRSYVAQTYLARGATTVAVTSPLGDEGKAFAAYALAGSLSTAGYKTLLVDFDLKQPALHPFAGVANGVGVCELLRGEADFRATIQKLPGGLHFLSAGKWSDEARQAAVGGRLESLLSRLKEPFDCVVIHAHALLTAAETVEVARRCEVVLLCTMYRETRLPLFKRAAERIATMEVPFTGVVYLGATANEALC